MNYDNSYFMPDGSRRCRYFKELYQCTKKYGHGENHEVLLPDGSIKEYPLKQPEQKEKLLDFF